MATEEQNNPLGDDALKAAAREAVKFQPLPEPDLTGMAEPAVAFDFRGNDFAWARQSGDVSQETPAQDDFGADPGAAIPLRAKLTLVSDQNTAEMARLEAARQNAIDDLERAIAQADDESKPELKAALQDLKDAKTPGDISAALTSATSKLSAEGVGGGSKSAGGGMAEINERHREMYANDPEYRRVVDEVVANSEARLGQSDSRERRLEQLAQRLGIDTPGADGAVEDARRALEAAKNGNPQERAEAERRYHEALEARNQERERIARERGDNGAAQQFGGGARQNRSDMDKTMDDLRRWQRAFIEANDRAMARDGETPEERERARRRQQQEFDQRNDVMLHGGNVQEAREELDRRRARTEALQQETRIADAARAPADAPAPGQNASATNGQAGANQTTTPLRTGNVATAANSPDLVADALPDISPVSNPTETSLAENKVPGSTPTTLAANTTNRGNSVG
ncbi:MAG: hypothetical protein ACK52W_04115 [Alphaproteobacteria bacterium]